NGVAFLPVPIRTSAGQSFVCHDGYLWELALWMPGVADYERSPNLEKLRAAMTALAKFHRAVCDFPSAGTQQIAGPPPAISRRLRMSPVCLAVWSATMRRVGARV